MSNLDAILEFVKEVEKLKSVTRGNRTLDCRQENSAEHSWQVGLMTVMLTEYARNDIDVLKTVKMLLIYDIVEIDAGDTWLYSEDQSEKIDSEKRAADRIFNILPNEQAKEFKTLWYEFNDRRTNEAKFAAAIDGLQPLINHLVTSKASGGTIPVELVRQKKTYIKDFAPGLWYSVERLIYESVEKGLYV